MHTRTSEDDTARHQQVRSGCKQGQAVVLTELHTKHMKPTVTWEPLSSCVAVTRTARRNGLRAIAAVSLAQPEVGPSGAWHDDANSIS